MQEHTQNLREIAAIRDRMVASLTVQTARLEAAVRQPGCDLGALDGLYSEIMQTRLAARRLEALLEPV